jgi:hypothetical protein
MTTAIISPPTAIWLKAIIVTTAHTMDIIVDGMAGYSTMASFACCSWQ